jgi:hypothetical protein
MYLKEAYFAPQICHRFLFQAESKKDGSISDGAPPSGPLSLATRLAITSQTGQSYSTLRMRVCKNPRLHLLQYKTYSMPGLTNSVESSLSEKRVVVQLILKFPAF